MARRARNVEGPDTESGGRALPRMYPRDRKIISTWARALKPRVVCAGISGRSTSNGSRAGLRAIAASASPNRAVKGQFTGVNFSGRPTADGQNFMPPKKARDDRNWHRTSEIDVRSHVSNKVR